MPILSAIRKGASRVAEARKAHAAERTGREYKPGLADLGSKEGRRRAKRRLKRGTAATAYRHAKALVTGEARKGKKRKKKKKASSYRLEHGRTTERTA